ncbi:DUF2971 domain-containing protein [Anaerospora hongkongensis]|uniref:DUF2971 domain-containing protein n=1 Tax=Anaerospora hongkongensis TaxID=244830 RepID=UPI0028A23452|nr:DUF2971 domain-containing protein [Anaerospora hongkongensis]
MKNQFELAQNLFKIFHPFAYNKEEKARENNQRFVYYTSAETAISILKNNEIWMRNATCMNDYSEVNYGLNCLTKAYHGSSAGNNFKNTLQNIHPNICQDIETLFNSWVPNLQVETYLTCVSEHFNDEDMFGRLSMWRAYGKTSGVAIVLKNNVLFSTAALKAYSTPVAYIDENGVSEQFNRITENIRSSEGLIREVDREIIKSYIFHVFKFAILSIKHPGFKEEQEWRIVYTPSIESSTNINKDIGVVNGTPQPIFKIPLKDIPTLNYFNSIPNIIDRIIIGPAEYPFLVYKAFVDLLNNLGVHDAERKIVISQIPLRR